MTQKKRRVTFDEDLLSEQFKLSQLRRQEKYNQRRSFFGILKMAMPVIMPYLIAVLILVASSMVPLPTPPQHKELPISSKHGLLNTKDDERNESTTKPKQPPILIDVASRMWDERSKTKEGKRGEIVERDDSMVALRNSIPPPRETSKRATRENTEPDIEVIALDDDSTVPMETTESVDVFIAFEVVEKETPQNAVGRRIEPMNPVAKAVKNILKILKMVLFPFRR